MKRRRTFTRDFKLKAVRYATSCTDMPLASIAKDLDIDRQALWAWIKEVEIKGEELAFPGCGRRSPRLALTSLVEYAADMPKDLEPLRAEIQMLRMKLEHIEVKLERTEAERDAFQRVLERAVGNRAAGLTTKENEA